MTIIEVHHRLQTAVFAGTLLLGTSCVAQSRYDEALAEIKYYQRSYQDLESFVGSLEAENARLKGELDIRDGEPIEAGVTAEIDERLRRLQEMFDGASVGTGVVPGDVTVLDIEGGYGLRLTDAILFDSGSTEIKPDGKALLDSLAAEILSSPFQRIWVRGHTDSDPVVRAETKARFPHGNLQLSAARAIVVAAELSSDGGIPIDKVAVAGFGPNAPVVPNSTAENKRRNRRVEIFVIEEDSGAPGSSGDTGGGD